MNMSGISIVFVTAGSEEQAATIGRTLVNERLAACANIVPHIRSIYRWKGQIYDEQEFLVIIKTRTELFDLLQERVKALHSYEVPEIVSFTVSSGLQEYLEWVKKETGEGSGGSQDG